MGESYSCPSGGVIAGGRQRSLKFADITQTASDGFVPTAAAGQPLMLELHGSGTNPLQVGAFWKATMLSDLAYGTDDELYWAARTRTGVTGVVYTSVMPRDRHPDNNDGAINFNSYHMGWTDNSESPKVMNLIQERRMTELLKWVDRQYPQFSKTKRYMTGASVGAWATMTYGIRRPDVFAALYPDRPRVRYSSTGAPYITLPDWQSTQITYDSTGVVPLKSALDGGGSMADHTNILAYVANTANRIPWVGWVIGKNDGYMPWQDQVDFVAAMRAAKRGFAVAWNLGNHSTGPAPSTITDSYYPGLFEIGVGYPLLTNNSGDGNPATDDTGGINLGFKWRNVVESAGGWSCEITNILGARTVTVEPISPVFATSVTPQNISIPAANSWVSVSF